jgi:hypothetical protein
MRADLSFCEIVIDDPEIDVVLNSIPESLFNWLKSMKRRYPDWNRKSWRARCEIYKAERVAKKIPGRHEFEGIDELMRLKLDDLQPMEVDYEGIKFGFDQKGTGIYSVRNGDLFYLGVQDWIKKCKARLTFLTTEAVITDGIVHVYEKLPVREPIALDLYAPSELLPVEIDLFIDKRAADDRKGSIKISGLLDEILNANPEAVIIANGTDNPRVLNFQQAKGVNGLEHRDVFVIVTCLCPDHYAELNAVGQWLELPAIIRQHYEDQISQAVGRNTGFRKSEKPTKTVVICSNRLAKSVLKSCFQDASARVRLQSRIKSADQVTHSL